MTFNTVSARTQRQLLHPSSSWAPQHPEDNHFANPKIHDHTKLLAKASLDPEFASRQAVLTTDTHERFKNVVAGFGERQCKKYRDIVYGMLGFGPWDVYLPVEVDHSRSVEEVYTDFAGAVLENKNFALFEDAAIWNRKNNEAVTSKTRIRDSSCLPSWVPERGGKTFESDIVPWKPTMINENWPYCTPIMSWPKNNRYERRLFVKGVRLGSLLFGLGFNSAPRSREDFQEWMECVSMPFTRPSKTWIVETGSMMIKEMMIKRVKIKKARLERMTMKRNLAENINR